MEIKDYTEVLSRQSLLSEYRDEDERRDDKGYSDDYYCLQDEEKRQCYENEGYQGAYDGNPDAGWNTD